METSTASRMTKLSNPRRPLSGVEVCDHSGCGARAYFRASRLGPEGYSSLYFCAHHARECRDKFKDDQWVICDETDKLDATCRGGIGEP